MIEAGAPSFSFRGVGIGVLFAALLLALTVGSAGCRKKPAENPKANEALFLDIAKAQLRADSVFLLRDSLKLIRGRWVTAHDSAGFEAFRDSAAVFRFIEERNDRGDYGTTDNRYYFDAAGVFFFYEDRGEEKQPRGSLPPMSKLVQRTLIVDPDGRPRWGRKLTDGVSGSIPDSETIAILERQRSLMAYIRGMNP